MNKCKKHHNNPINNINKVKLFIAIAIHKRKKHKKQYYNNI